MPTIYIVSTPIGNLDDISTRAIRTFKEVDLILCEDTRVTWKLLNRYQIEKHTVSYHQHSKLKKVNYIIDCLKEGKDIALVSDAGVPGISDPGNKLISQLINEFGDSLKVIPIPGPSAVTAALSISGFPTDKFVFLGFPPIKKKRKKFFKEMLDSKHTVIFFESCHRILKTLNELHLMEDRLDIVVCREMTKKFETIYRGNIKEVIGKIENDKVKGEFAVVVNIPPS